MEIQTLYEQTRLAFTELRRAGRPKGYPAHLRKQALTLLDYYTPQILSESFGVTTKTLQNWQRAAIDCDIKPEMDFVPLHLSPATSCQSEDISTELRLKLPHGLELIMPQQSFSNTTQLICALVKEFDQCSI